MAEQDCARRRAPPSRAVVSAVGWTAGFAAHGARRTFGRESETSAREHIAPGSLDRPASGHTAAGPDADSTPLPQQAAVAYLQWPWGRDARQLTASLCRPTTATLQTATTYPPAEPESQPPP